MDGLVNTAQTAPRLTHIGLPCATQSAESSAKAIPQGLWVNFIIGARSGRKFPPTPSARILAQRSRQTSPTPEWVVKLCAACQKDRPPDSPLWFFTRLP